MCLSTPHFASFMSGLKMRAMRVPEGEGRNFDRDDDMGYGEICLSLQAICIIITVVRTATKGAH